MRKALKQVTAFMGEAFYTIYSIVKGHIVTFVNLFRRKVTLQYPEVRWELPEGYRGIPCLPVDPETGKDSCIGCMACTRACPTQCIAIEAHMDENKKRIVDSFMLDATLCMFCNLCVEACNFDAIRMSDTYELACFDRSEVMFNREDLNRIGGVKEPKPKEPEEPEEPEVAKEAA